MKMEDAMPRWLRGMTLKNRIVLLFAACTLIPFACTMWLSYNAMSTILTSKLETSVKSNLRQVQLSLENAINNLNHVSQQLAYPGSVGQKLEAYLSADEPFVRANLVEAIREELNLITFTNPTIGLSFYYFGDSGTYDFETAAVKNLGLGLEELPRLADYYRISYFGPHVSSQQYNSQYVLSAMRQAGLPGREHIFIYLESGFKLTQDILDTDAISRSSVHLILDNDGRIGYSELPEVFPVADVFDGGAAQKGLLHDYYWYKATSNQGWSIVSLIAKAEYNEQRDLWVVQMTALLILFVAISIILGWLLWKMVYKPMQQFNSEIKSMTQTHVVTYTPFVRIPEFDYLLKQFRKMKKQIAELFTEVEIKEKRRADLEIEKLLYQINPHFLMNTLDTAHWLAVMNGQKEIDKLVLSLNKLLYYNLGKLGQVSTIHEEIESLRQYLILQQIRYDFDFDVRIEADEQIMDVPVPRFILQPLVENALYHGLDDDNGHIAVVVRQLEAQIEISVHDNGAGLTAEQIERLLSREQAEQEKVGMGIGMNYVRRMIESRFEGSAQLTIDSKEGYGTRIALRIPNPGKEERQRD